MRKVSAQISHIAAAYKNNVYALILHRRCFLLYFICFFIKAKTLSEQQRIITALSVST